MLEYFGEGDFDVSSCDGGCDVCARRAGGGGGGGRFARPGMGCPGGPFGGHNDPGSSSESTFGDAPTLGGGGGGGSAARDDGFFGAGGGSGADTFGAASAPGAGGGGGPAAGTTDFRELGLQVAQYAEDCRDMALSVAKLRDALKGKRLVSKVRTQVAQIEAHKHYGVMSEYAPKAIELLLREMVTRGILEENGHCGVWEVGFSFSSTQNGFCFAIKLCESWSRLVETSRLLFRLQSERNEFRSSSAQQVGGGNAGGGRKRRKKRGFTYLELSLGCEAWRFWERVIH